MLRPKRGRITAVAEVATTMDAVNSISGDAHPADDRGLTLGVRQYGIGHAVERGIDPSVAPAADVNRRLDGKCRADLPRGSLGGEPKHVEARAEVVHGVGAPALFGDRGTETPILQATSERQRGMRLHRRVDRCTPQDAERQRRQDAHGNPVALKVPRRLPPEKSTAQFRTASGESPHDADIMTVGTKPLRQPEADVFQAAHQRRRER